MAKSFFEIFHKYTPSDQYVGWLSTASDIRVRVDKEQRMLEASAAFPSLVSKRALYEVEAEIKKAYVTLTEDSKPIEFFEGMI